MIFRHSLPTETATPHVVFTPHLKRFDDVQPTLVAAATVRAALEVVFAENPRLRGYVLDEHGRLRQHVVVFVDGERAALDAAVLPNTEVYVMQALSGG